MQGERSSGPLVGGLVDEVGVVAQSLIGLNYVVTPRITADEAEGRPWSRTSLFAEGSIRGTARINSVTGKLELIARAMDINGKLSRDRAAAEVQIQVAPGVTLAPRGSIFSADAERMIELAPVNNDKFTRKFKPVYDKVSVVLDTRAIQDRAYVVYRGEVYLLEGIDRMAATGIRNTIKGALPAGAAGEFSIAADLSKIVRNPSKDPFYEAPASSTLTAAWKKLVNQSAAIGAQIQSQKNNPFFRFESPGFISPETTGPVHRTIRGYLFLQSTF